MRWVGLDFDEEHDDICIICCALSSYFFHASIVTLRPEQWLFLRMLVPNQECPDADPSWGAVPRVGDPRPFS